MTPREGWDVAEPWINTESVGCRVLAITKTTIMAAQLDKKKEVTIYPLHKRLANGGFNLFEMDPHCYRSEDAQVGDFLDLQEYKGDDKITYCLSFSIVMRPGGKVPPTARYKEGDWHPTHERREVYWALQNHRVPFPPHLAIGGKKYELPSFDPDIPRLDRLKRFPYDRSFTYMEYLIFMK